MFRVVLHVQNGALKLYSEPLETDSQANAWVDVMSVDDDVFIEHYDEYLGEWLRYE